MTPLTSRLLPLAVMLALFTATSVSAQAPTEAAKVSASSTAPPYVSLDYLRETYSDKQSKYFTIADTTIHYKDEGPRNAPVLFMVHGSESSLRTWDRITERLKGRYRIIRYDLPGYGLSDGATDEAADKLVPTDIPVALLERLGVNKVTFIGVSSGGTMGMYLAARRPALVERLILSNTPSDPVDTSHLIMPKSFTDAMDRAKATGFRDQDFWNEFLSYFSGDPARISAQTRKEYYDFYRRPPVPPKNLLAMIARIGDGKQARIEMAKVHQPVLLIWGTGDKLLPKSAAQAIERYLGNADISRILMPDVGHYPPLEVADRFAQLIAAYVEAATPLLPLPADSGE